MRCGKSCVAFSNTTRRSPDSLSLNSTGGFPPGLAKYEIPSAVSAMRRNSKLLRPLGQVVRLAATMRPLPGPSQLSETVSRASDVCVQVPDIQSRLATRGVDWGYASAGERSSAAASERIMADGG